MTEGEKSRVLKNNETKYLFGVALAASDCGWVDESLRQPGRQLGGEIYPTLRRLSFVSLSLSVSVSVSISLCSAIHH